MINNKIYLNNLAQAISAKRNRKTVFIIGAGASHEAANLPLGKPLADSLITKLGCDKGAKSVIFRQELEFLKSEYNFDPDDFKTILFALNKIDSKTVIKETINALSIYDNKFNSDVYSVIGQMFQNKQIDYIINFNFDEILDNEIKSKINSNHFNLVYSDLDITKPQEELYSDSCYIKPHGTISQPNTLRFQRKDYHKLEDKTNLLLNEVFSREPVDLVLIGFRLKFHDISTLLSYWLQDTSRIFIIDREEDILGEELKKDFYFGDFVQISNSFSLVDSLDYLRRILSIEQSLSNNSILLSYT